MEKNIKFTEEYKTFSLLSNAPCGDDLLEGKAHDKIAKQISSILEKDQTIKIIGIDGGWGSGKSNLVHQVMKNLKNKFHFFIYDAWGHQEDFQRRSILEELTEDLINNGVLSKEWKETLRKLLAKSKITNSKNIPTISVGIAIAILNLTLIPLFVEIANQVKEDWLKIMISSIPILCLFGLFIYFYKISKKNDNTQSQSDNQKKSRFEQTVTRIMAVYQNQIEENTLYETISEDEPSVRKFRNWMHGISDDLSKQKSSKILVIVFDNMDRLPQDKVKELWSSIHVFFAETSYDNIRVIVPFDRVHIQETFKKSVEEDVKKKEVNKENYGDDFINKTFDVVYRVSPPILSAWKKYFGFLWEKIFGEKKSDKEDYNNVVQIFDLLSNEITPRKIIAFINEFVSIKQVVGELIPEKYIALFIVGKQKISKNPIQEIIKPTYLGSLEFLYANDEHLPKYIAALFYQIDPEKAIEIIFTDKLKRALDNNNYEDISDISDIPNFYYILENSITQVTNVENAIYALDSIDDEEIGNKTQCDGIWNCLYKKVKQADDHKLQKFQTILLRKTKHKEEYLKTILSGFVSSEKFNAKEYYQSVSELQNSFKELNILKHLIVKNTSVDDFIDFIKEAKNKYSQYKVTCNSNELDEYLASLEVENYHTIDFIPYIINDYSLEKTLKKIEQIIRDSTSNPDLSTIKTLFRIYNELSKNKPLSTKLSDEQVYDLFQKSKDDEDFYYELVAMRIAKLEAFNPSFISVFDDVLKSDDDNIVEMIAEKIEYYLDYDNLLLGLKTFNPPLLKLVANKLVNKSYGKQKAYLISLISSFDDICAKGEIDPISLIKNLNKWPPEKITSENIKNIVSIYFLENALKVDCNLTTHCVNCLEEYLNSLSKEQWEEKFKDINSYEFQACILLENYEIPTIAFEEIQYILKEISEETIDIPDKDSWSKLIAKLNKHKRDLKTTFKNIRDTIIGKVNMNIDLFKFFGDWLFMYADLEKKQESLRVIFTSEVLRDEDSLNLIMNNKDKMILIFKAAEETSGFMDTIEDILNNNSSENLVAFAKFFGIEKKQDDQEKPASDNN